MKASLSGGLASLGAGTPYALAGKMAYPDRTVIACMGDGAMQMNGLNVMITISKYWKQWSNPRLIVLVLNNRDLNQVTWEERIQLGSGRTESTQSIPDFAYHRYAELLGLKGIFIDNPDRVGAAWDEALAADRPVILEAYAGETAKLGFKAHPHMLRHACGYALANKGHDTRALQAYLGHKNIQHTVRYSELAPDRFKDFWR